MSHLPIGTDPLAGHIPGLGQDGRTRSSSSFRSAGLRIARSPVTTVNPFQFPPFSVLIARANFGRYVRYVSSPSFPMILFSFRALAPSVMIEDVRCAPSHQGPTI